MFTVWQQFAFRVKRVHQPRWFGAYESTLPAVWKNQERCNKKNIPKPDFNMAVTTHGNKFLVYYIRASSYVLSNRSCYGPSLLGEITVIHKTFIDLNFLNYFPVNRMNII